MNKCLKCGKNCEKEYCFQHTPRKKLSSKKLYSKDVSVEKIAEIYNESKIMREFFWEVWMERIHRCEVTGEKIYGDCKSIYMHHILPKSKYPEAKFDKENIIILLPDIHGNVENDMYRYEIVNEKREQLIKKYGRGNQ